MNKNPVIDPTIPIILFGKNFWNGLIDWEKMIEMGTISKENLNLFVIHDDTDESFDYLINNMQT